MSLVVHGLPSLHEPGVGSWMQPSSGSQSSSVHGLPSSQFRSEPEQVEPEQLSLIVHWSPSSHAPVMFSCLQVPPAQVSVVHDLPSSQLTQAPPFAPQLAAASTKHIVPEMQPLQQVAPRHSPSVQSVPLGAATHVPLALQVRHSAQPLQSEPKRPH